MMLGAEEAGGGGWPRERPRATAWLWGLLALAAAGVPRAGAFNIATDHAKIFQGPPDTKFGFTVAHFTQGDGRHRWVLACLCWCSHPGPSPTDRVQEGRTSANVSHQKPEIHGFFGARC